MDELKQFIEILKKISESVESVNPAIAAMTEKISSLVEKFSATDAGMKSFLEMINSYVDTINRLQSTDAPIINIPKETVEELNVVSKSINQILTDTERLSKQKVASPTIKRMETEAVKQSGVEFDPSKIDMITPESLNNMDVFGEQLEKKFKGILERLRKEFNIVSILEQPTHVGSGIYRVVAQQLKEEGEEAKKVSFYIDNLGNVHQKLRYASKMTEEDVKKLTSEYSQLSKALKELGATEKDILSVRNRGDIGKGVKEVIVGSEQLGRRQSVYVNPEGRYGFTKSQIKSGFSDKEFNALLQKFPQLNAFVKENNLQAEHLVKAYHDVSKGIHEFTFSVKTAEGVVEKFNLKLDENGNKLKSSAKQAEEYLQQQIRAITEKYPRSTFSIRENFDRITGVSQLSSGVYKLTGLKKGESGEVEKVVRYLDRLGNVHEKLQNATTLTRKEIADLAIEFNNLKKAVYDYGYSLENIIKVERLAGDNAVKVTVSNENLGKLNLYADTLGRVSTTLRGMRNQIPEESLNALADKFNNLTKVLEKYGATLKDITSIKKRGSITEISFTSKDKDTGLQVQNKIFGDAQGRVVEDLRLATRFTSEEVLKLASAYDTAFKEAEKFGGSVRNLTKVIQDEKNNLTQLVFAVKDASGGVKEISLFTDAAGRVGYSKQELGGRGFTTEELERAQKAYDPAIKKAEKYGYTLTDLKKISIEASTGITRLTFAMRGEANELRVLNIAIDRHGNILRDAQRRYQGFLDGVIRNTIEASKWMIAIQLTYIPLQKFNELIEIAIDNQAKLANVAIGLNMSMRQAGGVFNDVAQLASATATPINEALEGFSAAYRATAGLGSQARRTAEALNLLRSSLILSKLAGIEQKESIDLLVGALRQANLPLSESARILDKWIAVSKNAHVGIADLAEAYSVVGSAALGAGFNIDKLNGVIAALVESTPYTGKEVGNILRSFISNIQSSEAQRQLNQLGIAVKDVNGEFRDFSDILDEISSKYSSGLINDDQMQKLARSLAGGSRRAAPFITLITQYGKALKDADVSAKALNESQKALNIQLETAKSSVINISNAFQSLAETAGTDGGLLDIFTALADTLEGLIKLMDDFVSTTGKAGMLLLTITPLLGYLTRSGKLGGMLSPVNAFMGRKFGYSGQVYTSEGWKQVPKRQITPYMAQGVITGGLILASAAHDYSQGKKYQATGELIGAVGGGIIAAALGQPELIPVATAVGSTIGSAFGHEAEKQGKNIAQVIAEEYLNETKDLSKHRKKGEKPTTEELQNKFFENHPWLNLYGGLMKKDYNSVGVILGLFSKSIREQRKAFNESEQLEIIRAAAGGAFGTQAQKEAIEVLKVANIEAGVISSDETRIANPKTPLDTTASITATSKNEMFSRITSSLESQTKSAFNDRIISAAEYEKRLKSIANLSASLPLYYVELGDALKQVGYDTKSPEEGLEKMSKILIEGTDDEIQKLTSLRNELGEVENEIISLQSKGVEVPVNLQVQKKDLQKELVDYINNTLRNINVRTFKPPQIVRMQDVSRSTAEELAKRAQEKMKEFGDEIVKTGKRTKDEVEAWLQSLASIFIESSGGMVEAPHVQSWALTSAKEEMAASGKYPELNKSQFGIRSVDFTSARKGEFHAALDWAREFVKTKFPEYKMHPQDLGIIYRDNGTEILHEDLLVVNMALKKMIELNQKQLDGIYNLPSGASFYVPYQAWAMQFNAQGSGGGGVGKVSGTSTETDRTAQDKRDAEAFGQPTDTSYMSGAWSPEKWKEIEEKISQNKFMQPVGEPIDFSKMPVEPYTEKFDFQHNVPHLVQGMIQESGKTNSILERIFGYITNIFGGTANGNVIPKSRVKELNKTSSVGNAESAISFNLELNHRAVLTLDGQIVAQAVSKYIGSELLRTSRGGSLNKSVEVI